MAQAIGAIDPNKTTSSLSGMIGNIAESTLGLVGNFANEALAIRGYGALNKMAGEAGLGGYYQSPLYPMGGEPGRAQATPAATSAAASPSVFDRKNLVYVGGGLMALAALVMMVRK